MREPDSDFDPSFEAVSRANGDPGIDPAEIDSVPTTAGDVASAGRSCLVIVALAAIIVLLLVLWIIVRSTGGR